MATVGTTMRIALTRQSFGTAPPCAKFFSTRIATTQSYSQCVRHNTLLVRSRLARAMSRSPVRYRLNSRGQSTRSSPSPNPSPNLNSPKPSDTSLSARFKRLSRDYGWSAFGVYLALSALDFPFCFLAVRWLGVERIGRYEQAVIGSLWHVLEIPFPGLRTNDSSETQDMEREGLSGTVAEGVVREGVEAGVVKKENASIWTQLALAYAVHKSLIFFRVPLTAAVTPKVVKTLRGWGWDIAKKRTAP